MSDGEAHDDFVGNPWHPFLRVLRRRAAKLSPDPPPSWDDLFRLDPLVRRLVPARGLTEAEIRALAHWPGLLGEEHASQRCFGLEYQSCIGSFCQHSDSSPGPRETGMIGRSADTAVDLFLG